MPVSDTEGVRLISLLDRFFQAGRRQRTPIGSYAEFEAALVRFAAAGPEATLRAADLLAAESPVLALELVASAEISAAAVLVRAIASAELDDFPTAAALFDELSAHWGVVAADLDIEDRSRWIQAMTDVGRFAEAEEACLRTIAVIEGRPAEAAGWTAAGLTADAFEHWRYVYRLLAYRLAAQQGRYREAWDHLRKSVEVDDTGLPADLRRSILRIRILLADEPMALGILSDLRAMASTNSYDTAYAEACLWAGTQWGTPVVEGNVGHESPFSDSRYTGQAAARALLAQAGPDTSSRQRVRLARLAGDDDRAAVLLAADPLTPTDPWSVQVLSAMLALRVGDDVGATALRRGAGPTPSPGLAGTGRRVNRSLEDVELAELLRQQVVEGRTALGAVVLHDCSDVLDRCVERCVVLGKSELALEELLAHGGDLCGVAGSDVGRVPVAQHETVGRQQLGDDGVVRLRCVLLDVCSPIGSHT